MNGRGRPGANRHRREEAAAPAMAPRPSNCKGRSSAAISKAAVLFAAFLVVGVVVSAGRINNALLYSTAATTSTVVTTENVTINPPPRPSVKIPFTCPTKNQTSLCSSTAQISVPLSQNNASPSCPDYFRWIHEDLRPWKKTGITQEMVQRAARTANFRLVVLDGRVYIQKYRKAFQTRDVFTIWGILQLLRRYSGQIPDLDLMFDCVDWPVVHASYYQRRNASAPPPLFRYCANDSTLDIVFPDWSYWGWPEINIRPWGALSKELMEGTQNVRWMDRQPYAYWKGNPWVAETRQDLLKCNVSEGRDWNARLYSQDWLSEIKKGFNESNLSSQCVHRYKIYIEGSAWSVSDKYILACDSVSLVVKPKYYDFFTRGLMPLQHYWPIKEDEKCRSIKYAVDWGNSHKKKAQAIGKEASSFIQEQLKLDYVYDYMFHLLNEYARLLKYKPMKPRKAVEVCAESMACPARGLERRFMMESMINATGDAIPCSLSPPYTPVELGMLKRRRENNLKRVEMWEERAWKSQRSKL